MIASVLARRYAKAIVELGVEGNELDGLVADLGKIAQVYAESAELRAAMTSPTVSHAQKKAILGDIADRLGVGRSAKSTVFLLNDRRRVRALPDIAAAVREMAEARKGMVRAEVTSAKPLGEEYIAKLKVQLERMTGKRIAIDRREDPDLIAGVVVRIGDTMYDGSLRSRLDGLKTSLLN